MNEVFASYIDILISYSDKFLTILPISFVALIGSFYLLFKSIGDIKNREQYSKFQLISSSGTFILNVVAFAIGIIGLILENENTQFKLFISEILIISASFVLLILCFISIYKRTKLYEPTGSWPRESNVGLGLIIFEVIFDIVLFVIT